MRAFRLSRIFTVLLALLFVAAGTELLAQGKGRGNDGQRGRGQSVERGNRGGGDQGRGRAVQHVQRQPQQQAQQQVIQQNRGGDRRIQMQQRMQQIQRQRQQQAQQRVIPQNRGGDRRILMQQRMQQIQQQRQQQAQQRVIPHNRDGDRRIQMQQRMQQIQQQRQQQAQQRVIQQNRGGDRRIQMQQRMQQIQQQRQQQAQQRVWQNRGNDRRVQTQQGSVASLAGRRGSGVDRRAWNRNRQGSVQPQIIPQQKARSWSPQAAYGWQDQRRGRGDRGRDRSILVRRQPPVFSGAWPQNYGQQRRAEVFQRNADRRAWRDRTSWGYSGSSPIWQQQTYTPVYRPRTFFDSYVSRSTYASPDYRYNGGSSYSYYDSGYSNPYYADDYDDRPSAADIFRNVIFAVLGGGVPVNAGYADYGSDYVPDHYDTYSPRYAGYDGEGSYPAGYSYATDPYYYDPYFYEDPQYAEVLPIQYFVADQPGSGLFRQMFTHLLAIGYDQGFQDGVAAKRVRERDRVFYDPYAYDNASFDPYSVSLGDNRRCLSQGYELGYQDAIDEYDGYAQFENGGVDLVSVLIGTVSQLI